MGKDRLLVIAGNASRSLAEAVGHHLGQDLGQCDVTRFTDGEVFVQVEENVRGVDLFIVQSTYPPAEHLVELLFLIDACRRSGIRQVMMSSGSWCQDVGHYTFRMNTYPNGIDGLKKTVAKMHEHGILRRTDLTLLPVGDLGGGN